MLDIQMYADIEKIRLAEEENTWVRQSATLLEESFAALAAVATDDVEPLVTVLDIKNVLREDVAQKLVSREELLSGAPEQYDGYFQVPRTLD